MTRADWLSTTALACSFVTVILSWALQRRSERTDVASSVGVETMLRLDMLFVEHPEWRPYFREGKPVPDHDQALSLQLVAVAEFVLDSYEVMLDHRDYMGAMDAMSWIAYVKDMLASSPLLMQFYAADQARDWYPQIDRVLAHHSD